MQKLRNSITVFCLNIAILIVFGIAVLIPHLQTQVRKDPKNKYVLYYDCQLKKYTMLTLMLLVANFANTKWCKKPEKWLKPCHMGTHLRELGRSYPMDTNSTGFRWFSAVFASMCFALDEGSLSIGKVKSLKILYKWLFSLRGNFQNDNKSCYRGNVIWLLKC